MDLRAEMDYPAATADDVFAMIVDPEFRAQVCRQTRATEQQVAVDETADGGAVVSVRRTIAAEVPAVVKSFVGERITVDQTETWGPRHDDGSREGRLSVQFTGQPATVEGSIRLEPRAGGAHEVIDAVVKVSIPFVGRMVEPELAKGIVAATEVEERLGRQWLTTR